MSTVGVMTVPFVVRRSAARTRRASWSRRTTHAEPRTTVVSAWQLYGKPRAARRVVADLDAPAMLGDDPAHDGEAEPAAAPLGRVVRQEQFVAFGWRDARSVVSDDHPNQAVARVEL